MGRRLQDVRRCRGAVEDVARLMEAVRGWGGGGPGGGGAGWAGAGQGQGGGEAGRAAGMLGECRSHGNVGIVFEKLQTFQSIERARREFVGKD